MTRALALGSALWLAATLALRLAPAGLLRLDGPGVIVALYAGSFGLMFIVMRQVANRPGGDVARLGIALLLPTLVLDALASAFFPAVYPNFPAGSAGVFGGWMLVSCGGGLAAFLRAR